ncbi:MAG: hypothetical protein P1R58_01705 [bacterium]|nr:hypothetical protein [bacterium]
MTDKGKKEDSSGRIKESKRFSYIGFEVFPGEPKDLFKSDAEKKKFVGNVQARRDRHDIVREDCKLLEERVSLLDKVVMTIASIVVIAAIFAPWYSVYNEVVDEPTAEPAVVNQADSLGLLAQLDDSLATVTDSDALNNAADAVEDSVSALAATAAADAEEPPEGTDGAAAEGSGGVIENTANEQILHGYVGRKSVHKEYEYLSGLGMLTTLGSVGSSVFSSGFVLIISAVLMLLYLVLCIALPGYTLYGLYGLKGDADQKALALKRIVRFNWIPVIMFVLLLFISFFGADYGFDAESMYSSLGSSYGIGTLFGTLNWGVLVSLCGFVLVAAKGSEI